MTAYSLFIFTRRIYTESCGCPSLVESRIEWKQKLKRIGDDDHEKHPEWKRDRPTSRPQEKTTTKTKSESAKTFSVHRNVALYHFTVTAVNYVISYYIPSNSHLFIYVHCVFLCPLTDGEPKFENKKKTLFSLIVIE